ncbi:MAG: hypothetical protein A3K67_04915 [Euryarchaeota archaeon RBG_16_62_10]|nr:MAG: hypothetical protein A3K67_04915 [Euryarchaeota archaeon RBG_16_62_10]
MCFGAGMLAWMNAPKSSAATIFIIAMWAAFVAVFSAPLFQRVDQGTPELGETMVKMFAISAMMAQTLLWQLTIVFPIERRMSFRPLNAVGAVVVAGIVVSIALGSTATGDYGNPEFAALSPDTARLLITNVILMIVLATVIIMANRQNMDGSQWRSAKIYLTGLWLFVGSGLYYAVNFASGTTYGAAHARLESITLIAGILGSGIVFAASIAKGLMEFAPPRTEKLLSSSKAKYKLLHRRIYLVHEAKPDFSTKMFTDILKSRCFDCENDESFPCESLDCSTCSLPCPCRACKKYSSRAQGLIITRQYPKEVRARYFIQTTPITWLSTVAGKDNMDPAKLSLLTDFLVNFMERSQNGVVLVDGLEYLVTSNDFHRVLRAVDRWTETAMASNSRLIMSVDPKAFDSRELALLERNREVVRPDAAETWRVIPERI